MSSRSDPKIRKLYYRIGEVAKLLEVEPSTIRHWESELSAVRPRRTNAGQRLYTQQDLDRLSEVKRLRFELGYTIRGTQRVLRDKKQSTPDNTNHASNKNERLQVSLLGLRKRIVELINDLDRERTNP